jgi:hypothetical protein
MQRLSGVEKTGRNPGAVERRGDFLRDGRILSHAGENQFATGSPRRVHPACRRHKFFAEFPRGFLQRLLFNSDARACTGKNGFRLQRHLEFESSVRGAEFKPNDSPFNSFSA